MQIGIVAEGKTDQAVIEHIIVGALAGADELFTDRVQPPIAQGGPEDFGNWELVLRWLASERCRKALQFFDLLVVQIDTDVCERAGFDVATREGGIALPSVTIVDRVAARLAAQIGTELMAAYRDRIVFAVAYTELECWLLPLIFDSANAKARKDVSCFDTAHHELAKRGAGLKSAKLGSKDPARYAQVSRPFRRPKELASAAEAQPSLQRFVDDLAAKAQGIRPPGA